MSQGRSVLPLDVEVATAIDIGIPKAVNESVDEPVPPPLAYSSYST